MNYRITLHRPGLYNQPYANSTMPSPPPFVAPTKEPHTYTGICRCKANKFTIDLPELTGGLKCNCSICSVHDAAWTFVDPSAVRFEREGDFIEYAFNEKKFTYQVCPTSTSTTFALLNMFQYCANCSNLVRAYMKGADMIGINVRVRSASTFLLTCADIAAGASRCGYLELESRPVRPVNRGSSNTMLTTLVNMMVQHCHQHTSQPNLPVLPSREMREIRPRSTTAAATAVHVRSPYAASLCTRSIATNATVRIVGRHVYPK